MGFGLAESTYSEHPLDLGRGRASPSCFCCRVQRSWDRSVGQKAQQKEPRLDPLTCLTISCPQSHSSPQPTFSDSLVAQSSDHSL